MTTDIVNKNFLSPLEFKFSVSKLPHISWFLQSINIPGINSAPPEVSTPFRIIPLTPDMLVFEPLRVKFKVDEDMNNFFEIYDWMHGIGFPDDHEQYRTLKARGIKNKGYGLYSDASLTILSSNMVKNVEIVYHDIFPSGLGEINFDTTEADVQYLTCDVEFRYLRYTRRRL